MADQNVGISIEASGSLGAEGIVSLGRLKSEFNGCNVQFGDLNPLGKTGIFNAPFQNKKRADFFTLANLAIEKASFVGILPQKGPFIGIVLGIESSQLDKQPSEKSWIERGSLPSGIDVDSIFSIRVRIPELHAHLPIPKTYVSAISSDQSEYDKLGGTSNELVDSTIIRMHPIFSSQPGTKNQIPQIGSMVLVDFADASMANGIYIESLSSKTNANSTEIYGKSKKPFDASNNIENQKGIGSIAAKGQSNDPEASENTQVAKPKGFL